MVLSNNKLKTSSEILLYQNPGVVFDLIFFISVVAVLVALVIYPVCFAQIMEKSKANVMQHVNIL